MDAVTLSRDSAGDLEVRTPRKADLLGLHLVRGLCAISVMIYHYCFEAKIGTFFAAGTYGVYIFFVLSGFALTYVYGDNGLNDRLLSNFLIARVFRIVPLYSLVTLYQIYYFYPWNENYISKAILNMSLFFGLSSPGITSIVPGGWSIGIEAVFYILFPVAMLFKSSRSLAILFIIAAIVSNASRVASYADPAMEKNNWMFYTQAPTFLVYFIGGVLIARIHPEFNQIISRIPGWNIIGTILTLALMMAMFIIPHMIGVTRESLLNGGASNIMIASTLLVILLASTVKILGPTAKIARFLGEISFSLYLVHYIVWNEMVIRGVPSEWRFGASTVASIIIAFLLYTFFERPIRDLRKRFLR